MKTTETDNLCGLKREDFQTTVNGKQTDLYILKNSQGNEVAVTNYGGALVAIMVPDRDGKHANVIQGHDNIQSVINSPEPYLSTLIGRYGDPSASCLRCFGTVWAFTRMSSRFCRFSSVWAQVGCSTTATSRTTFGA